MFLLIYFAYFNTLLLNDDLRYLLGTLISMQAIKTMVVRHDKPLIFTPQDKGSVPPLCPVYSAGFRGLERMIRLVYYIRANHRLR